MNFSLLSKLLAVTFSTVGLAAGGGFGIGYALHSKNEKAFLDSDSESSGGSEFSGNQQNENFRENLDNSLDKNNPNNDISQGFSGDSLKDVDISENLFSEEKEVTAIVVYYQEFSEEPNCFKWINEKPEEMQNFECKNLAKKVFTQEISKDKKQSRIWLKATEQKTKNVLGAYIESLGNKFSSLVLKEGETLAWGESDWICTGQKSQKQLEKVIVNCYNH